ncbi:hypothetical protein AEST_01710 [Alishewanella aestuarii B11]|uniref:Metal-binding protein n=2 Tax=Alishewanella aestuarii TaxID=453835 RepID=J1YGN4_9ALTE|nr:hypothetical protein AEST_01710 [Alishewanella aestuarii B11]
MGKFSKLMSERSKHTKVDNGHCLICGKHGHLSFDHVPPKGAVTITKIEQRHIGEMTGENAHRIRGVPSLKGSGFKTICQDCNNRALGGNDDEIAKVCSELTGKIRDYFQYADHPGTIIQAKVNPVRFTRAMIGHVLAATSAQECIAEPKEHAYFDPLKRFVLGDNSALDETHDIYYWFYPYRMHLSAKELAFWNNGHTAIISLLSFFPIAFMITKKNEGVYPPYACKLSLTDTALILNLSTRGFDYAEFPFHDLKGNQMRVANDTKLIVSYPIK